MNRCPNCKTSLIGKSIPFKDREHYSAPYYFKREIGIDGGQLGIYDGIVAFRCPDCAHEWAPDGSKRGALLFSSYLTKVRKVDKNNNKR